MCNVKTAAAGNQVAQGSQVQEARGNAFYLHIATAASASHRYRREKCIAGLQMGERDLGRIWTGSPSSGPSYMNWLRLKKSGCAAQSMLYHLSGETCVCGSPI